MNQSDTTKVFRYLYQTTTNFDSKESWDKFYAKNKEDIDAMTTNALNIKYKVDGYRFGRKQKQLFLFPVVKKEEKLEESKQFNDEQIEKITDLQSKLNEITSKLNETSVFSEEQLKQITDVINKKLNEDFKKINIKLKDLNDRLVEVENIIDQICNSQQNY